MNNPSKTLLFVRHGESQYTGVGQDLTEKGKQQMEEVGTKIASMVTQHNTVAIVTSPQPRAVASADIIASRFGMFKPFIRINQSIRCMDIYDENEAIKLFTSLGGVQEIVGAYQSDPHFESGKCVEKRSAIKERFNTFFKQLLQHFIAGELFDLTCVVSHYELLINLIADHNEPTLDNGEIIRVDIEHGIHPFKVVYEVYFRDRIIYSAYLARESFSKS